MDGAQAAAAQWAGTFKEGKRDNPRPWWGWALRARDSVRHSRSVIRDALVLAARLRWFFTLYPSTDIRWNFGDAATGQTGRLFPPFDALIGKKFSDLFNVSLEVGVPIIKQYPVYNFMTALRFNLTF